MSWPPGHVWSKQMTDPMSLYSLKKHAMNVCARSKLWGVLYIKVPTKCPHAVLTLKTYCKANLGIQCERIWGVKLVWTKLIELGKLNYDPYPLFDFFFGCCQFDRINFSSCFSRTRIESKPKSNQHISVSSFANIKRFLWITVARWDWFLFVDFLPHRRCYIRIYLYLSILAKFTGADLVIASVGEQYI